MGSDAACTLLVDGKATHGRALLEQKSLIFRGPVRLVIPLADITSATAEGNRLDVEYGGRHASLVVGSCAATWARKITHPPSRAQKLGLKAGAKVLLVGHFEPTFEPEIIASGARVLTRRVAGSADLLFYAAGERAALARLASLVRFLVPAGALWIIRPKGQRSITEVDVMRAGRDAGLVDVKVVRFSDTHTAEKFVIPVARRLVAPRAARPARRAAPRPRS